jgi:hypothetical protein
MFVDPEGGKGLLVRPQLAVGYKPFEQHARKACDAQTKAGMI